MLVFNNRTNIIIKTMQVNSVKTLTTQRPEIKGKRDKSFQR